MEQITDGLLTADEHNPLGEQAGFEHIAVLLEPLLGETGITEEGEGFLQAGHGPCSGERFAGKRRVGHQPGAAVAATLSILRRPCAVVLQAGLAIDLAQQLHQLLTLAGREFTPDLPLLEGALLTWRGMAFENFKQASFSRPVGVDYDKTGGNCQALGA